VAVKFAALRASFLVFYCHFDWCCSIVACSTFLQIVIDV